MQNCTTPAQHVQHTISNVQNTHLHDIYTDLYRTNNTCCKTSNTTQEDLPVAQEMSQALLGTCFEPYLR